MRPLGRHFKTVVILGVTAVLLGFCAVVFFVPSTPSIDRKAMQYFGYKDKFLSPAYVESVTQEGVTLVGWDLKQRSASILVPLEDAGRMTVLRSRAGKAIAEAQKIPNP